MDNFFNYITKEVSPKEVDIWFKSNRISKEKLELFSDFAFYLNKLIHDTYLGYRLDSVETKIIMSNEDNHNHFEWCWNKTIDNFISKDIIFNKDGGHFNYFQDFYFDIFYTQDDDFIKNSIENFLKDLFDFGKGFTKSDLDTVNTIYIVLDKNLQTDVYI